MTPIYWTKKSVPELASLSKDERERIWNATLYKPFRQWQTWVAAAALVTWVLLMFRLAVMVPSRIGSIAVGGVGWLLGAIPYRQFLISSMRPYMRAAIDSQQAVKQESSVTKPRE